MGLETFVALVANGATFGSALVATYGVIGAAAIRLGASVLLSAISARLSRQKVSQQQVKQDLRFPTSQPEVRHVVGSDRAAGTPLPYPVVGEYAYGAYLVNSLPSVGPFTIFIDNREVFLDGDPFDFSGPGATATNDPFLNHLTVWIGRGDQTSPPQVFLDEAGYEEGGDDLLWRPTDAGQGCTIVFMKMRSGDSGQVNQRWRSAPPRLDVEGRFSRVWDPRDPTQIFDDPTTHQWSENNTLHILHAITRNPFRRYRPAYLNLDMIRAAADVCDETMPLKSGGTEARYTSGGTITYAGRELEDLVGPLLEASASTLTRVGGRLGIVPGVWRPSILTIRESFSGLSFSSLVPEEHLYTEVRASYSSRSRGYEPAELRPYTIPGAQEADGGEPKIQTLDLSFCTSGTQAQRVRNINAKRGRLQRNASIGAPQEALEAVSASTVALELPEPYASHTNGLYEVVTSDPFADPVGEEGLALVVAMSLRETGPQVFAWNHLTDEEDIIDPPYDGSRDGIEPPSALTVASGAGIDLNTGATIVPRFRFDFMGSETSGVTGYEWEWLVGDGAYQSGGLVNADTATQAGMLSVFLPVASVVDRHDFRVRAVASDGRSNWVYLTGALYGFELVIDQAVAGLGRALFTIQTPETSAFKAVRAYRSTTADFADAVAVGQSVDVESGQTVDVNIGAPEDANVFSDAGFDDPGAWSGPDWTVASGVATHGGTNPGDLLLQPVNLPSGAVCRWKLDVVTATNGDARVAVVGDTTAYAALLGAPGTYSGALTAPQNPTDAGVFGTGNFVGSVDNIVLFEETPDTLPAGTANFWLVPVAQTGIEGAPVGPVQLTIQ